MEAKTGWCPTCQREVYLSRFDEDHACPVCSTPLVVGGG